MKILVLIGILFTLCACIGSKEDQHIAVYKTRQDYSRNLFAGFDGKRLTYHRGPYCGSDTIWPVALAQGYYLDNGRGSTWWETHVPTTLTIAEYTCCLGECTQK